MKISQLSLVADHTLLIRERTRENTTAFIFANELRPFLISALTIDCRPFDFSVIESTFETKIILGGLSSEFHNSIAIHGYKSPLLWFRVLGRARKKRLIYLPEAHSRPGVIREGHKVTYPAGGWSLLLLALLLPIVALFFCHSLAGASLRHYIPRDGCSPSVLYPIGV